MAFLLKFPFSNNQAEYEVLIISHQLLLDMQVLIVVA